MIIFSAFKGEKYLDKSKDVLEDEIRVLVVKQAKKIGCMDFAVAKGLPSHPGEALNPFPQFATLKTRRKLSRVNFRKDVWDCYWFLTNLGS